MSNKDVPVQMGLIDSPGSILLRAREAKGLGIADIAAMLHLSESKVKAIESDDFDSLPEPVFVRGYIQNYARLLDEPVAPILESYAKFGSESDVPEQKIVDSDVKVEDGNRPDLVKIVTIGVAVALILIPLIIYWDDLGKAVNEVVGSSERSVPELPAVSEEPESSKEVADIDSIPFPDTSKLEEAEEPTVEDKVDEERVKTTIELNSEEKTKTSVLEELELPESVIKPITVPAQPVAEEAKPAPAPKPVEKPKPKPKPVIVKPVAKPVSKTIPLPSPKTAPVESGVWFNFVESGWVKVRDADNRVILIGEHKRGERKKLTSRMPYKVVLGNSDAVKVEINGRVVNINGYSSGGVARFTINNGKIGSP